MKKQILTLALILATAQAAFAQGGAPTTPRVDRREARQEQRIEQGVASGQLTPRETARLQAEQARIQGAEARAKSDGVVTAKERVRLDRMQNKASRDIGRAKHNRRRS